MSFNDQISQINSSLSKSDIDAIGSTVKTVKDQYGDDPSAPKVVVKLVMNTHSDDIEDELF